jgi:DNA-binding MarR family transcriptional regulator
MPYRFPFVRLINLLNAIDDLPLPMDAYNRHRSQYHFIMAKLALAMHHGRGLTVAEVIQFPSLGSQPTAHKRIKELLAYQLITVETGEDRRQKLLRISDKGVSYLQRCSMLVQEAAT